MGGNGDSRNDNTVGATIGVETFVREDEPGAASRQIHIAAGDYEDVRLRVGLFDSALEKAECEGAEWNVSWEFNVR